MSIILESPLPGVMQIRIDRPERMNALGVSTVNDLLDAIGRCAEARVVLLRGTGTAFCAGADLKERAGMDAAARYAHNRGINRLTDALGALPMPVIAVLNGLALGGGLEIALACDLRFAALSAKLGLTEARIGAIPGAGGTQRLPRLVGTARALQMMFSGEPIDATTAERWNLVQAAFPDAELDTEALRYAAIVASRSPRSARMLKRVVQIGMEQNLTEALVTERDAVRDVFASADYAEGLLAFAERRAPVFSE